MRSSRGGCEANQSSTPLFSIKGERVYGNPVTSLQGMANEFIYTNLQKEYQQDIKRNILMKSEG